MSLFITRLGAMLACSLALFASGTAAHAAQTVIVPPPVVAPPTIVLPAPTLTPVVVAKPDPVLACRDAALAALPFTGTTAERERQATHLADGTDVVINRVTVSLPKGETIWSLCRATSLATANMRIMALEADLAKSKVDLVIMTAERDALSIRHQVNDLSDGAVVNRTYQEDAAASREDYKTLEDANKDLSLALVLACVVALFAIIGFVYMLLTARGSDKYLRKQAGGAPFG